MRVVEVPEWGIEKLRLIEAEAPQAGAGQVLVRFGAASVNYRDYQIVAGEFSPGQPLPIIPFSDGAGVVESVGAGVTGLARGDRVATLFFPDWMSGEALGAERAVSSGLEAPGVLRELGVYQENAVAKVAAHLSDEEASCLPCAGVTAWNCLTTYSGIKAGDTVLVQGTGGVAIMSLQFAKAMGAQVIVTSSSDERLKQAQSLGADYGINYGEVPEWGEAAKDLTGGRGVDAVIEIGGEGTLPQSIASIRRGGHINIIGYLAGYGLGLSVIHLIERNAHLHGLSVGNREQFEAMMGFIAKHHIRPVIARTYSLEKTDQALRDMAGGGHFGKLVVTIKGTDELPAT
jgi:NADPH:quinone reductase-like Zn-dependent oxidoreductase